MDLLLASANEHKFGEFRRMMNPCRLWHLHLASKWHHPVAHFPPENGDSFLANARIKAAHAATEGGAWALADDSGLVVPALEGEPGIYSARYGGSGLTDAERVDYLLHRLKDVSNRQAFFVAVLSLFKDNGSEVAHFRGRMDGVILREAHGKGGFGYDPVFQPLGYNSTLAQLPPEEKNRISHRGHAVANFIEFSHKKLNDIS